jgi:hypothetical protein
MNRLYILLTVMVVMVGVLFTGQEALAEVLIGTALNDTLVGTDGKDRHKGPHSFERMEAADRGVRRGEPARGRVAGRLRFSERAGGSVLSRRCCFYM